MIAPLNMSRRLLLAATLAVAAWPVAAVTIGDDGLHKEPWMRETFKDLREDLAEANAEGKRLMLLIEQRGCIYCTKMHEEVFSDPQIASTIENNYFVVQLNMFGDVEVVDFDGDARSEKDMVMKWGAMFTPTMIFLPEEVPEGSSTRDAAVATMPGAFGKGTTRALLQWVRDKRYEDGENFQRYVAEQVAAGQLTD